MIRAKRLACALVLVLGCGHPPTTPEPPPTPPPPKSVQMNAPGATVNIEAGLVPGYVTIVDFWSESCGACHVVGGMMAVAVAQQPQVLIRKVDVGDAFTPVAEAYKIGALPHYRIYDKRGRMRYQLIGNDCLKAGDIAKELVAEQ